MLNRKGFVLLDALVSLLIVSLLSLLVLSEYQMQESYKKSLTDYFEKENERWSLIYEGCNDCRVVNSDE